MKKLVHYNHIDRLKPVSSIDAGERDVSAAQHLDGYRNRFWDILVEVEEGEKLTVVICEFLFAKTIKFNAGLDYDRDEVSKGI